MMIRNLLSFTVLVGGLLSSVDRAEAIEIEIFPEFQSASVYVTGDLSPETASLRYRAVGEASWMRAAPLIQTTNNTELRLSLLGLKEGTRYSVEVVDSGEVRGECKFETLRNEIPIARTVSLGPGPHVIREGGSADGWVRYVAEKPISVGPDSNAVISLLDAEYVLLENLKIRGGQQHGIRIEGCKNIRVKNCDIAGWGEAGEQDFRRRGWFFSEEGDFINRQAGISIRESDSVVVEQCFIHDPRGTANSWVFGHPAGPSAIFVSENRNTVVRYNDLVGSDRHRWNDVIGSARNRDPEGGFQRDAAVYGNFLSFGNDDAMELDGGQMNIRVWGNWIEGTFAGISTAPCIFGPSYLYDNLIVNPGGIFGLYGNSLKNSYRFKGHGTIYFSNNTVVGGAGPNSFGGDENTGGKLLVANNIFFVDDTLLTHILLEEPNISEHNLLWHTDDSYLESFRKGWSKVDESSVFIKPKFQSSRDGRYALSGNPPLNLRPKPMPGIPEVSPTVGISEEPFPHRPTTLRLSRYRVHLEPGAKRKVSVELGSDVPQTFRILKNETFNWFRVRKVDHSEAENGLANVEVWLPEEVGGQKRGVFFVKSSDGFSRPVVVSAGSEQTVPMRPKGGAIDSSEAEAAVGSEKFKCVKEERASGGLAIWLPGADSPESGKSLTFKFNVPTRGTYFLAARYKSPAPSGAHNSLYFRINDGPFKRINLSGNAGWNWSGISRTHKDKFEAFELLEGSVKVEFKGRERLLLDAVSLISSPASVYRTD